MDEELVEMLRPELTIYSHTPTDALIDLLDDNGVDCWDNGLGNVIVPWDGGVRKAVELCMGGMISVDDLYKDDYYGRWNATITGTGSLNQIYVSFRIPSHPSEDELALLESYSYIENGEEKIDLKNLISSALL
jgi:hypothetical protein